MKEYEFLLEAREFLETNIRLSKERCERFEKKLDAVKSILKNYEGKESEEESNK